MSVTPEVRIGGEWLSHQIDGWGDLVLAHRRRGPWEMTFNVALALGERPPFLIEGATAEGLLGSSELWAGEVAEIDWDSGAVTCVGAARKGEETLCLTSAGATTSTPNVAIDQAIARGALNWTRPASISNMPVGESDETSSLNYLTALLDAWEVEAGTTWAVDARRQVVSVSAPMSPSLQILPGASTPGGSSETLAGTIFGRYQTVSGVWQTVSVGSGKPEVGVGLKKYGGITAARATTVITQMLDRLGPQFSWSAGVELTAEQVVCDGTPVDASQVVPNIMIEFLGQDKRMVLDETSWNVAAGTIQAKPVGLAARDLRSVVEDFGGEVL